MEDGRASNMQGAWPLSGHIFRDVHACCPELYLTASPRAAVTEQVGVALENGRAPTMLTSWPLAPRTRSDAYPTCALPSAASCARTPA